MGTNAGPAGAAGVGLGTAVNAYGQSQGIDAMRDVWAGQNQRQAGYDQQLAGAQQRMLAGITPQSLVGAPQAQARGAALDNQARTVVAAAKGAAGRKTGGARGGAEAQAAAAQAGQGTLAQALSGNRLAAILAGLQQAGQQQDILGRTYNVDQQRIRGDAQRWAALAPLQEQAAGMHGGEARQIGNLFNTAGQFGMNYAMSQPRPGAGDGGVPQPPIGSDPMDYQGMGTGNNPWAYSQTGAWRR